MNNEKIEEFDPLGVLLSLLNKDNLDISNFSLAQVADDYLDYLEKFKEKREILENISEFVWVASKLAFLKSKILLNSYKLEEEPVEEENDLKERLFEYKKFKEIREKLKIKLEEPTKLFSRKNRNFDFKDFVIDFDQNDLRGYFFKVVQNFNFENERLIPKKSIEDVIKIEEKIKEIKNILDKFKQVMFSDLNFDKSNNLEVVVSFLSILELFKQGMIRIEQEGNFKDMNIVKN